jgi:acid phosphatase type 7
MCEEVGGCGPNSPQIRWLQQDLADDKKCTLAYFHHPLFTSGRYSPSLPKVKAIWEALYEAGADVVLSGHDHNYQRFAPQHPEEEADPRRGIREFVVGTGGKSHYVIASAIANTQVYDDETFGVLKLTLRPGG